MERLQVWGPVQDRLKKIQELLHAYTARNGNKKSRKRSRKQRTRKLRKHSRKIV